MAKSVQVRGTGFHRTSSQLSQKRVGSRGCAMSGRQQRRTIKLLNTAFLPDLGTNIEGQEH